MNLIITKRINKEHLKATFFTITLLTSMMMSGNVVAGAANKIFSEKTETNSSLPLFVNANGLQSQTNGDLTFLSTEQAIKTTQGLESLLYDVQPALYLDADGIKKYGHTDPVVAFCTPATIAGLYEENPDYAGVRAITIKISSAQERLVLDIAKLSSFSNLEYIQLVFEYDVCGGKSSACLYEKVQPMLTTSEKPITVLYQLNISE